MNVDQNWLKSVNELKVNLFEGMPLTIWILSTDQTFQKSLKLRKITLKGNTTKNEKFFSKSIKLLRRKT